MPKHRKKQHWNDWTPGFHRNNRQRAINFQRNIGQDPACNSYDNPYFQNHYTGNYSDNLFDASYQRNFTRNHDQCNFNQNYQTQNARKTEFNRNYQKNSTLSNNSISELQLAQYQRDLEQNTSTKNVRKNSANTTNPWYKNKEDSPKQVRKRMPKGSFAVNYYKKTENFTEKGFIIKETLYKDPDLFYNNDNSNTGPPSNCEANDNWTDAFWQKHDDSSVLEGSRSLQESGKVSKKNQNRLERTLNDMLSKPAEMSKGKSLLQKMGWRGGGLGRDGDGITEPIAPKATYAVNTIGLGHLTEKPKKPVLFANMSKKKLQKPEFRNHFCTNALLYILEFVKNDEENKIVFEPRLSKLERKRIHQIVEKIRVSDNLDDFENFENFSDKHLELVKDIWVHNCYELWTESEGVRETRRLCLFKEAPAHVYLVTPEDLTENDESNDKNENDDEPDDKNENDNETDDIKKEKVNVSDTTTSSKGKCDSNQYLKEDVKNNCNDIKKEISESINSQLDKNNQILVNNERNRPENRKTIGYICKEIIPKMEMNDQIIIISDGSDSEDEMATNIHKDNEVMEENQQIIEEANICNDIIVKMEINKQNTKINGSVSDMTIDINDDVKTVLEKYDDHTNEITVQMEINDQNTKIDENISDTTIHDDVKPKLENLEHTNDIAVKMEITEGNTKIEQKVSKKDTNIDNKDAVEHKKILFNQKEDQRDNKEGVLAKIVKYFKEFSSDETFKEFRFLGPFNGDEMMHINLFFDICMKQDGIECDEKYEVLAAFDNDSVKFDVLEDNNGKIFIKKVGDSPELPSEDEEVVYASGVYL